MRFNRRLGYLGAVALCVVTQDAQATDICGNLFGTLGAAGSPYRATCDLVVPSATTLVIDPGVELRFKAGIGMQVFGDLQVNGTSGSPAQITSDLASPVPGDWAEITVSGTATIGWTTVRFGQGIVVSGTLDVANSVFELNGGPADPPVISFGTGSAGSITDSTFDQNDQPLLLGIDANPLLTGLSVNLNHNVVNGVEVAGGTWTVSRTWTDPDVPYAFNAPVTFAGGTTQTIQAGVIFKFFSPDDLVFDDVTALGTASQPVIITSIWDDAAGGDTFPGPLISPAPGDWDQMQINGTANLGHLQVRYGTDTSLNGIATFSDCRFTSNAGGVSVLASADFSDCVFELGQNDPAVSFGPGAFGSVTGSLFDGNHQPLLLSVDSNPTLANLTVNQNHSLLNGVDVQGGSWTVSRTWTDVGVPYVFASDISFAPGTTQNVDPGVVFKMLPGSLPTVKVSFQDLNAIGTAAKPIFFTSLGDTSIGGDTFPMGLPLPVAGDWGPLEILGAAGMVKSGVQYGSSIDLSGSATITDSFFGLNSEGVVVNSDASITGTTFTSNGLAGGAAALAFAPGSTGTVSSGLFAKNYVPILLGVDSNPALTGPSILEDHILINGVQVAGGSWTVSRTWTNVGVPYMPDFDITFAPASTQTVDPGVVFKFVPFGGGPLEMSFGSLLAFGTPGDPIVFTSAVDDSIAPNALVGVPGPASVGDWAGLVVQPGGVCKIAHTRVSYAQTALDLNSLGGTIDQSTITHNGRGLNIASGGSARVTGTDLVSNDKAVVLDATSTGDLGDLGDADPLNDGLNNLICNGANVQNMSAVTLPAENNFWLSDPPDPALIFGPVDVVPYISSGPRPIPSDLMAALDMTGADVQLQWEDIAPVCGYRVFRSTQPDTGFVDISGFEPTNGYSDTGAGATSTTHFYFVLID